MKKEGEKEKQEDFFQELHVLYKETISTAILNLFSNSSNPAVSRKIDLPNKLYLVIFFMSYLAFTYFKTGKLH